MGFIPSLQQVKEPQEYYKAGLFFRNKLNQDQKSTLLENVWTQLNVASRIKNEIFQRFQQFWRGVGVESHKSVEEPLISVVIPVYNAEKFIQRTIDSVLFQLFDSFEVVCVDDGSTDSSAEIIKNISKVDERVRLISNERNRGTGYTRARAVRNARGQYVYCLDSDDEVAGPLVFKKLAQIVDETKADVIHFSTLKLFFNSSWSEAVNNIASPSSYNIITSSYAYFMQMITGQRGYGVWGKLIRR
jgi:cellulose synthase/poly-beta-1,6-N-acetylglucosamine synthase-like glycosyltransferase